MLIRQVQLVEGVEHFFLRAFLVGKKLHVVHHKHVQLAILCAEVLHRVGIGVVVDGFDKLVYELIAGYVHYFLFRVVTLNVVAYCVHKVRFP